MASTFWDALPRPFFLLAPMADVTDAAFRRTIAHYSKPHGPAAMFTEFVSADGLLLAGDEGKRKLMGDLLFSEEERPIVAQFFTSNLVHMERAAALARELGFDGVDINMGCPDRSIEKQGAGAALIKNPKLAQELIAAAKRGAGALPVSVKTRLGYGKDVLDEWLPALLEAQPAAITIHARTRKEMSKVPAHWERVKRAVEIRDAAGSRTLIVGNGDVVSIEEARARASETGADGVMIGKGIFGNPWLFSHPVVPAKPVGHGQGFGNEEGTDSKSRNDFMIYHTDDVMIYHKEDIALAERLRVMVEHTKLFEELLGDVKSFAIMKKHFKAYVSGFDGAHELRTRLMEATDAAEVERLVAGWLADHGEKKAIAAQVE